MTGPARRTKRRLLEAAPWMAQARCRGVDTEIFYPQRGEDLSAAQAICADCPVRAQCLAHALDNRESHGVWGGLSERRRRRIRRHLTNGAEQ